MATANRISGRFLALSGFEASCLVLMLGVLAAWIHYALGNSWFIGQDFDHLILMQDKPLAEFLLTPIDIHYPLPLHRFFSWLVYQPLAMNFTVAVGVLAAFFLGSCIYLYLLLQEIAPTRVNAILLLIYVGNVYLLDLFLWWSAGLHRFPYLFCAIACCYHVLKSRHGRQLFHLLCCVGFFVLALAFFEKAILIPVFMLAVVICAALVERRMVSRSTLIFIAGMCLLVLVYVEALGSHTFAAIAGKQNMMASLAVVALGVDKSLQSLSPLQYMPLGSPFVVVGFVIALALVCLHRRIDYRISLLIAVLLLLLVINFVLVALSGRAPMFGAGFVLATRYYFENVFIFVTVLAFMVRVLREHHRVAPLFAWLAAKPVVVIAVLTVFVVVSFSTATSIAQREYNDVGGAAAVSYIGNLRHSLHTAELEQLALSDQSLDKPIYLRFIGAVPALSRLAVAMGYKVRFESGESAGFFIDTTGKLQQHIP